MPWRLAGMGGQGASPWQDGEGCCSLGFLPCAQAPGEGPPSHRPLARLRQGLHLQGRPDVPQRDGFDLTDALPAHAEAQLIAAWVRGCLPFDS